MRFPMPKLGIGGYKLLKKRSNQHDNSTQSKNDRYTKNAERIVAWTSDFLR
jgi:hypothetical protein